MGERKGTNKYYPPDYDPKAGGLNKFLGTHALRERARKLHLGILIIRFEMPYNIWCEGCGNHVGMGVRYNAEKKKVGMYYTTPIFQFRMKCHLCDNHFLIRTDPANLDYVIESGARRQEKRFEAAENGTVVPDDRDTINRLSTDAMFKLDKGDQDSKKAKGNAPRIQGIASIQDRIKDDYLANRILRDELRAHRKREKATQAADQALLHKASLPKDMQLLPEHSSDVKLASLMKLNAAVSSDERRNAVRKKITEGSIFATSSSRPTSSSKGFGDSSIQTGIGVSLNLGVRVKGSLKSGPEVAETESKTAKGNPERTAPLVTGYSSTDSD